jgi:hypothetical protein
MTWDPKFHFLPVSPFRKNIRAALLTNQVEALAWAASQCGISATPPPLAAVYTARAVRDKYPVANLLVMGSDPQATNGGDYDENKRLLLEVETIENDTERLIEILEPYVLMVRSVVTEMTEEQLTSGVDVGGRDNILLTVGSERYGERPQYDSENTFTQVGSVIATLSYREIARG